MVRQVAMRRDTPLRIAATLPIRSLHDGKRRLAPLLSAERRQQIIAELCRTVVNALRESGVVDMIALVSRDDATLAFGETLGLAPIWEERPGLNEALQTAGDWAREAGAEAQMIVLPDLPLLRPDDLRAVVYALPGEEGIVACPDRTGTGTNLLLMRPCGIIAPGFGTGSFERHLQAAHGADVAVATVDVPGTRWDVDTPDDLAGLSIRI